MAETTIKPISDVTPGGIQAQPAEATEKPAEEIRVPVGDKDAQKAEEKERVKAEAKAKLESTPITYGMATTNGVGKASGAVTVPMAPPVTADFNTDFLFSGIDAADDVKAAVKADGGFLSQIKNFLAGKKEEAKAAPAQSEGVSEAYAKGVDNANEELKNNPEYQKITEELKSFGITLNEADPTAPANQNDMQALTAMLSSKDPASAKDVDDVLAKLDDVLGVNAPPAKDNGEAPQINGATAKAIADMKPEDKKALTGYLESHKETGTDTNDVGYQNLSDEAKKTEALVRADVSAGA